MTDEKIVKGQISAMSEKNLGILIEGKWFNAVSDIARDKFNQVSKGDYVEIMYINIKDIVDFIEIKKPSLDEIVTKIKAKTELLAIIKGEVEKVFYDSDKYKDLSPIIATIFRSVGGDRN